MPWLIYFLMPLTWLFFPANATFFVGYSYCSVTANALTGLWKFIINENHYQILTFEMLFGNVFFLLNASRYCSQVLSKEIDNSVIDLLKELVRFQDRLYLKDPLKAKMKRRLVMGLREVLKHLKLKKVKCVIISPNCERVQSKGSFHSGCWQGEYKLFPKKKAVSEHEVFKQGVLFTKIRNLKVLIFLLI